MALVCCKLANFFLFAFAETCHETKFATAVTCPKDTQTPGYCVVTRSAAFDICAEIPGCKYVLTTSNADWNTHYPDAAMLGKDPLSYKSEWKSCELPAKTRKFNEISFHSIMIRYIFRLFLMSILIGLFMFK